ncbi:hypothetical protein CA54_23770 [Symmachiella macrocystis]|uniref:Uncharacterized protein n=1 Tax=Symmachiella macrocystis TaxID=2527985 RepID=A0A5C6BPC9_9PLAN|nr:hypothetical protein CA54_23770 [Symmachiella macrocystis]
MFSPIPSPTEIILLVVKFGCNVGACVIIFMLVDYLVESMRTPRDDERHQ